LQSQVIANIAFSKLHLQDEQLQPTAEKPLHLKVQPVFLGVIKYSPLGRVVLALPVLSLS